MSTHLLRRIALIAVVSFVGVGGAGAQQALTWTAGPVGGGLGVGAGMHPALAEERVIRRNRDVDFAPRRSRRPASE